MLVLGGGDAGAERRGPCERLARGVSWVGVVETAHCYSSGLRLATGQRWEGLQRQTLV